MESTTTESTAGGQSRGRTRTRTPKGVRSALDRGLEALIGKQREDGSYECWIDVGPVAIASQLIVEEVAKHSTNSHSAAILALRQAQRDDGSFGAWKHAAEGAVPVTALAAAALGCAGVPADDPAVTRAWAFVNTYGGLDAVGQAFVERGEASAIFLVACGAMEPDVLPPLPLSIALTPLIERLVDGRVHAGNLLALFSILAVGAARREPPRKRGWFGKALRGAMREFERQRAIDYISSWQNPDGSFNQALFPTQLMALGLSALGVDASAEPLAGALRWLDQRKAVADGALRMQAIPNDVWSTAQAGLALSAAHRSKDAAEALQRALAHLRAEQLREPQPRANQRKRGARRTGGWAFQRGNPTMPDCDDTGLVLACLGASTPKEASREAFASIDDGVGWVRDMQNPDGGWAAYVWNLPSKQPGPMFIDQSSMPDLRDPTAALSMFLDPPAELGDPSTEGVTARVLWGLGACGVGRDDAAVCHAIEFLKAQQCESGAFWDRWMTCYLPGTANVLIGLAAVGEDMDAAWVVRAIEWMCSCQNDDGGFGESPEAFVDPNVAGQGPSMPAVTGFVVSALVRAGHGQSPVVERAVRYLLRAQREDGSWNNEGWVNPYVPPDTFYEYELSAAAVPCMALADYLEAR